MNLWKSAAKGRLSGGVLPRFGRWLQSAGSWHIGKEVRISGRLPRAVEGRRRDVNLLTGLWHTKPTQQHVHHHPPIYRSPRFHRDILSQHVKTTEARMAAPFFLAPLLLFLKSGTALKTFSVASRVALAVAAPLRLRSKYFLQLWHGPDYKFQQRPPERGSRRGWRRWTRANPHFKRTTMFILGAPIILFSAGILASLERTPVWGRWRVIMISTDEEAMLVEEFLRPGTYHITPTLPEDKSAPSTSVKRTHVITTTPRDWLAILRVVCGEPAQQPAHVDGSQYLLGTRVLDPRTDWRARWVNDVLLRLEEGVRQSNLTSDGQSQTSTTKQAQSTIAPNNSNPPPVNYPLSVRPALFQGRNHDESEPVEADQLVVRYGCLVLDRPECNAFSLGFGPALADEGLLPMAQEAPGVVVMNTGLLDEILRSSAGPVIPPQQTTGGVGGRGLFGLFSNTITVPLTPTFVGPTPQQTEQLAVTLAHELGHLLLSHSLEAWASQGVSDILTEVVSDMARTILYPLTAVFGPVFNDWFGRQVKVNAALGLTLASSCESRKAEIEADLLALRILQAAGFDPRAAIDVWGPDGLFQGVENRENEAREKEKAEREAAEMSRSAGSVSGFGRVGSQESPEEDVDDGNGWLARGGFLKTHPATEERHLRIVEELARWEVGGPKAS